MRQRVTFRQTEANCTTNCPKLVQIGNVAVCNEAGIGHFARYSARYSTAELAILWSISTDVYVSKDQYLCTGMSCPRTGWNILLGLHIIQLTQIALFGKRASTGSVRVTEFPMASHLLIAFLDCTLYTWYMSRKAYGDSAGTGDTGTMVIYWCV